MPRGDAPQESDRTLCFKDGFVQGKPDVSYADNVIKTSKYTCATFVPVNLFEQLHKFGNVYFVCISIVMYLGEVTALYVGTIKAFSTISVLVMMMAITAAMALLDDLRRKEADNQINSSEATTVVRKSRQEVVVNRTQWAEVTVGDILLVRQNQEFPADMVPLYCSGEGGNCYVSTANLDGETNLKLKTAPGATQSVLGGGQCGEQAVLAALPRLSGQVVAEAPTSNIHDFNGNLTLQSAGGVQDSLGHKQLLLRGTVLRNTAMCLGIAVYCGADTRMVRNSRPAPMKQSNLERVTNAAMVLILVSQACLALLSSVCHELTKEKYRSYWYLYHVDLSLPDLLAYWLTFFTLYSNLMPISLYPTAEFCNVWQSYFLRNDRHMYYKAQDFDNGVGFCARARSSNLCQELGQVSYIFSDKTGTLTQNLMELKRLSIAGQTYGELTPKGGELEPKEGFSGKADITAARRRANGQAIDAFLEALSVAHTVMVSQGEDGKLTYQAESPDEDALVAAVADLGFVFRSRKGSMMTCEWENPDGSRSTRTYTVLATNEFTSTRKRMSVVVQRDSEYMLFVKGADNVMLERAQSEHKKLEQDLKEFSREGLRTLVIGWRRLSGSEVSAWQQRHDAASRATREREEQLAAVAEEIERPIDILGATAIEDKLQDEVPETIVKLRDAGIKLWVLTGDKLETARNIGFSTKVLTEEMNIQTVDRKEGKTLAEAAAKFEERGGRKQALMVTGDALAGILESERKKREFLDVAESCSVLIACRVSPMQKAEMVKLVREGIQPQPVTLAVGDGANDVPMIQEAQVGVGIAGREGRQSVNNSDFAIAQFRYLQRLLLVHGRWNYLRACKFTLFTFWRNMVQVLLMFYYTFVSGYSGTVLFEDWIRLSFNLIGSIPILAVGCFDQDVTAKTALDHPELYAVGRLGLELGPRRTLDTICDALAHSAILFLVLLLAFPSMDLNGAGDYYTYGTTAYTCLIVDMTVRAVFLTHSHNRWTVGAICLALFGYICWLCVYPCLKWVADLFTPNMFMVPVHMVKTVHFWLCILTAPLMTTVLDVFVSFLYHHFYPDTRDRVLSLGSRAKPEEQRLALCADVPYLMEGVEAEQGDSDGESSVSSSDFTESDLRQLDLSDLGQQQLVHQAPELTWWRVAACASAAGGLLLAVGLTALWWSMCTAEVLVVYSHGTQAMHFLGLVHRLTPVPAGPPFVHLDCTDKCTENVTIPWDIEAPVWVYYVIDPFYQNYNDYIKSEVIKELEGQQVPTSVREDKCWAEQTRELADGTQIVPCGMKATSLFNDTFFIEGVHIVRKNTAWESDIMRYENPEDYPGRPNTSWLFQRYPSVIPKPKGVDAEAFATWMRPSAISRTWKKYGYINTTLKKNQTLRLTIHSEFRANELGASKMLALTEQHALGGRHDAFGALLVLGGLLCFFAALSALCLHACSPGGLEVEE